MVDGWWVLPRRAFNDNDRQHGRHTSGGVEQRLRPTQQQRRNKRTENDHHQT